MKFYLKKALRVDYYPKTADKVSDIEMEKNTEFENADKDLNSLKNTDENLNLFEMLNQNFHSHEEENEKTIKQNDEILDKSLEEIDTDLER